MFRKRTQRGFIAWLAIAALGLLLVAPTISRTLAALSPAAVVAVDGAAQDAGHDHTPTHHDPVVPSGLDACAYCVLMSHSPVLTAALMPLLSIAPAALPATRFVTRAAPLARPLDVRPRGPPLS